MKEVIRQVARENNRTEEQVVKEIKTAIREAMRSTEPEARAFWKEISPDGEEPSIGKVIASIALKLSGEVYQ